MTQYSSLIRVMEVKNQSKNGATFMKSIFCLLLFFFTLFSYGQEKTSFNVNDSAKDFVVQMINGEKIKLSELKGKVVLLNFWADRKSTRLNSSH